MSATSGHPLRANDRVADARAFAAAAHGDQLRKGTTRPYMVHPLETARIVARYYPANEDLLIAALLHDTIEDTHITEADIAARFGARIAHLVAGVSAQKQANWRATREASLTKLRSAEADIVRLKAADGLSNVRSMARDIAKHGATATWAKFRAASPADIGWYHASIANVATDRLGRDGLVTEYRRTIASVWPDAPLR